jgi:hypothetical protein
MLAFWGKKEKEDERGDKGRNKKNYKKGTYRF